jgi:hypothetical protein
MANERLPGLLETHPHLKDFLPYLDVLNKESGRGKVLVSCSFLEQQLEGVLRAFMRQNDSANSLVDGPNAPVGTFYTLSLLAPVDTALRLLTKRLCSPRIPQTNGC